ncbi:MAG: HEPN domain-containing protein, partial [Chloroflexi bacterium]
SVASYLDFELDLDMLKKLNEVYVDARYPGEFGLLPYTGPTLADAQSFYEFARDFLTKVQEQLEESRST